LKETLERGNGSTDVLFWKEVGFQRNHLKKHHKQAKSQKFHRGGDSLILDYLIPVDEDETLDAEATRQRASLTTVIKVDLDEIQIKSSPIVPLGRIVTVDLSHTISFHHQEAFMDMLSGSVPPTKGLLYVPPRLQRMEVHNVPKLVPGTVLQNLRWMCGEDAETGITDEAVITLTAALGLSPELYAENGSFELTAAEHELDQRDAELVNLARTMLCLPDVMVISKLSMKNIALLMSVLHVYIRIEHPYEFGLISLAALTHLHSVLSSLKDATLGDSTIDAMQAVIGDLENLQKLGFAGIDHGSPFGNAKDEVATLLERTPRRTVIWEISDVSIEIGNAMGTTHLHYNGEAIVSDDEQLASFSPRDGMRDRARTDSFRHYHSKSSKSFRSSVADLSEISASLKHQHTEADFDDDDKSSKPRLIEADVELVEPPFYACCGAPGTVS
jgi:hypothetical protein